MHDRLPGHARITNPFLAGDTSTTSTSSAKPAKGSRAYESLPSENIPGVSVSDPTELPEHIQHVFAAELGL